MLAVICSAKVCVNMQVLWILGQLAILPCLKPKPSFFMRFIVYREIHISLNMYMCCHLCRCGVCYVWYVAGWAVIAARLDNNKFWTVKLHPIFRHHARGLATVRCCITAMIAPSNSIQASGILTLRLLQSHCWLTPTSLLVYSKVIVDWLHCFNTSISLLFCHVPVCIQSIYHVTYMRGLFPDAHFKGIDMMNLDGEMGMNWEQLFCRHTLTYHHSPSLKNNMEALCLALQSFVAGEFVYLHSARN